MSSQDPQSIRWHFTAELNENDLEIHGLTLFFIVILFAVVVLITLLLVYVRWVCRHQHHHFPSHPSVHAPNSSPSQPQGLHPRIIKAITITSHLSSSTSSSVEAECCICLGVFEDGDKVKVLALCHHSFHSECLDRWLAAGSSCPLCRASLHCGGSAAVSISTD